MPVLPLEPFLSPGDLLDSPAVGPGRWWVLHTRPRAEKALTRGLLRRDVPFFLPLGQRQLRRRGETLTSYLPLFPGYCFLYGDEEARLAALTTNLVVRCLAVEDQEQLHAELAAVHRLMLSGCALTPQERLQPGAPIEITAGPLAGLRGKVLRRGKRWMFLVEVQFLQRGVSVEIEGWMIQPLS